MTKTHPDFFKPEFRQKRLQAQRFTERDALNFCRVGKIINFNDEVKMIVMTSTKHIYFINKKRKITKVSVKKWKCRLYCEVDDKQFASMWDKSICRKLNKIRREEAKKKIMRSPTKKKIKRTPMKKKIQRSPAK